MNAAKFSPRRRPEKPPENLPLDKELVGIGAMTAIAAFNLQLIALIAFKPFSNTHNLIEQTWPIPATLACILLTSATIATIHVAIIQKLESRHQKKRTDATVNQETL